jgi:predicted NodU family carbamoyl transferase
VLNLAARHKDGQWVMLYLGSNASFSVNLNKLAASKVVKALWIDPRTGQAGPAVGAANNGVESFSMPEGSEDAVLLLEPSV